MDATSLFNGAMGVKAHMKGIESAADNLANVSTVGYKHTRTNFYDLLSGEMALGQMPGEEQVGNGAYTQFQNMMYQGALEPTEQPTDLAVNGRGFFKVVDSVTQSEYYTRAGQFRTDLEGYLVNPQGLRLQGEGGDIQLDVENQEAQATEVVGLGINLDAEAEPAFAQNVAIDPTDTDTYHYSYISTVYDAEGGQHHLATFYQRMDDFTGQAPDGSVNVWKAAVFEYAGGNFLQNPAPPENEFFLHFDSNGHLVGTSDAGTPDGASYRFDGAGVAGLGSPISDQLGESFAYTGATPPGEMTFISSAMIDIGAWAAGESIDIGGSLYEFDAGLTSADLLVEAINLDAATSGVWAGHDGVGGLTLYSDGAAADAVTLSAGLGAATYPTLQDLVDSINDGAAASGALYVTPPLTGTESLSIGGTAIAINPGDTAVEVAAAINTALAGTVTATAQGNSVLLSADAVGSAGNLDLVSGSAAITTSGAAMAGGMDGTAATHVVASTDQEMDTTTDPPTATGNLTLALDRDDLGADADVVVTATLGANLGLDFAAPEVLAEATGGSASASAEAGVEMTLDFSSTNIVFTGSAEGDEIVTINGRDYNIGAGNARQAAAGLAQAINAAGSSYFAVQEGDTVVLRYSGTAPTVTVTDGAGEEPLAIESETIAATNQNITFDYSPEGMNGTSTAQAGGSETLYFEQDGYAAGVISDIYIEKDGRVIASFSNGQQEDIDTILLAGFISPGELMRAGDNLWVATPGSGEAIEGVPGDENDLGMLAVGALETSTVDVAQEMVNMINYQRAFQANSKSISTTDEMLKTAINLKS